MKQGPIVHGAMRHLDAESIGSLGWGIRRRERTEDGWETSEQKEIRQHWSAQKTAVSEMLSMHEHKGNHSMPY